MSVDQIPTREAPRPDTTKLVRYEDFIESKIQSTRSMVKVVDLATAMLTLVIGVLAYLLVIAVVEHWIVPGGFSVIERTGLFAVLIVSVVYFAYKRVWPPLVRAINPVYAAQAIEHSSPALKNSLINLLFFRERRTGISESVYRTLEEQAAQRLTRVPIETSVDRSLLIRLGYVLVAIVALAGLYKVLSPKDPIVSAGRVLLPWANIVPASRVVIGAVTPGSLTVSRGEFVDVSAEVRGLGDDEEIVARYTTDDGQVVGRAIPMRPAGDGLRYTCRLSEDGMGAEVGLTRDLKYRLEAGDARSLDYAVTVVSAPSILVERVDYHYPPYTGFVDRSVDSLGDIRAIEGTRMTVHARANGEIRVADVDFDADGRPDVRMNTKESGANASFELGLREDRVTPRHASYVLRFTNDEGRTNRDPVKHSIAVERDIDPEVAVLLPKERAIDVRLDETVAIEIEARDPDFALAGVRLHGEVAHQSMLDESLLKGEHRGKYTTRYTFTPTAHGLKIGDIVQYWVEATDNRTPKANTVTTERRTIRIVSPNPGQPHQPPPDRVARNDRQQPQPGEQQGGEKGQGGQQGGGQGEQNQGNNQGQNDRGDQQQGESGGAQQSGKNDGPQSDQNQQSGQGNNSGEQNGAGDQQQSKDNSNSGGEGQGQQSQSSDEQGNDQKAGKQGQGGGQSKSGNDSSDQQKKDGEQHGSGASGGGQSKDGSQSKGDRGESGDKSQQSNGQPQGNKNDGQQKGEQGQSSEQKPAVSSEGDNDGEAFERIRKRMEQTGDLNKDAADQQGEKGNQEGQKADQQPGSEQQGKQQGTGDEDGKQQGAGDQQQQGGKSSDGKSDSADGKSAGKADGADQEQQPGQQGKDPQQSAGAKESGDGAKDAGKEGQQGEQEGQKEKSSPNGDAKSKGAGGAGEEQQPKGSPNSQPDKKPTDKHQQSPSNAKDGSNKSEPPSGARGKKESDSAGDQGGDKAGGGEEGEGQKSPRDGTGSAGQNQSADKGAGQSGEKGKGDTSSSGGQDKQADGKTGSSDGKTKGDGSQQKDGTGSEKGGASGQQREAGKAAQQDGKNAADDKGKQAGGKEGEQGGASGKEQGASDSSKQDGKQQQDGKAGSKSGDEQQKDSKSGEGKEGEQGSKEGKSSGQPEGGGNPGGAADPQTSITGTTPEGDAANLDYARKQTDLVLNKLADQLSKNKVDDRMLKELGWTRDDLRRFVERWQQRKDAAKTEDAKGEAAKRELDDALRSLGLQQGKLEQNAVQKDTMRDLKQGYRGAVPLEYKERLRAYNQGVSRANREEK